MFKDIFPGQRSQNVELALLLGLAFVLPLYEAPKNILGVLFFAVWTVNRLRSRQWGGPWGRWDTLIAGSILVAVMGTPFAGIKSGEWLGLRDVVRTFLLLWCILRAGYSPSQWLAVFAALIAGTLMGSLAGAWNFAGSSKEGLELHSIGHSNHTATYLCTVFGIVVALLAGMWSQLQLRLRVVLLVALLVLGAAVVATGSRAALLCLPLLLAILVGLQARRSWKPALIVVATGALVAVLVFVADPWVIRKHSRNLENNNVLAFRDLLWERATTAWRAYPVFGIGMDNFPRITTERYRQWTLDQGRAWDPVRDYDGAHAHSLYFDTLSERGAVGAVAMLAFFFAWATALIRNVPRDPEDPGAAFWLAAVMSLATTLFIGLVNSTFHNEQAAAAIMCLAAWLTWQRSRQ